MMNPFTKIPTAKSLKLYPFVFEKLHDELLIRFSEMYSVDTGSMVDYQLYGFDLHDSSKPNLKNFIREKTGNYINGKYLYNKKRDFRKGRKVIKLTREYTYVYFNALGYKSILDFMSSSAWSDEQRAAQFKLCGIYEDDHIDDEFYVGYYYGEYREVIKTKLTIYNQGRNVDWVLVYWEDEKKPSLYTYKGVINESRGAVTFHFPPENADTGRSAMICVFFGNNRLIYRPFMAGTYSGFDKNDCPVVGKIIFERVTSAEIQENNVLSKATDITISDEVVNERIAVNTQLPQNKFELSEESINAHRIANYSGRYTGFLINPENEKPEKIHLVIEENSNEAVLDFIGSSRHTGYFKLLNHGEVLCGFFDISRYYNKLNIVLNARFHQDDLLLGVYSGIGQHNRPTGGRICFGRVGHDYEEWPTIFDDTDKVSDQLGFLGDFFLGHKDRFSVSYPLLHQLHHKLTTIHHKDNAVYGTYEMYYQDENEEYVAMDALNIGLNGDIEIRSFANVYQGTSKIFGDGILSINVTACQNREFYAQITIFVGQYQNDEIKLLSGIYSTLGRDYSPMAQRVVLCKTPEAFETIRSERYKVKSQRVTSLCETTPMLKALLTSPDSPTIKAPRTVN